MKLLLKIDDAPFSLLCGHKRDFFLCVDRQGFVKLNPSKVVPLNQSDNAEIKRDAMMRRLTVNEMQTLCEMWT